MAEVVDRWHLARPPKGAEACGEHKGRVPSATHGKGKRWQVRWRDAGRAQRKENFERKVDADRRAADIESALNKGAYVDPRAGRVLLRDYGEKWLKARTIGAGSRETIGRHLKCQVYPVLGDYELRALKPSVVQAWLAGMQRSLAPNYVRAVYAALSSILSAAVDDELLAKNPCAARSVKAPPVPKRTIVPWTGERVSAIREHLPERYRAMVALGAGCGMRQGEIFGLGPDDVDWLKRVVHVRRQVKIVGNRTVFALPKGGRERDVPLPDSVSLELAAHVAAFPPATVTLPWDEPGGRDVEASVFFSFAGRAVNRGTFNERSWVPALERAGVLPPKLPGDPRRGRDHGMHQLRHRYASVLLDAGVSVRALADYLGHADPGFTLRVYAHLMPASEDRARKAVDEAVGGQFSAPSAPVVPSARGLAT